MIQSVKNFCSRHELIQPTHPEPYFPDVEVSDVKDEDSNLLDMIYSADPVSGFPFGDIAAYNNKNTRPEIRQYISQNLLVDMSDTSPLSLDTNQKNALKNITDDDIAEYKRFDTESKEDYALRMKQKLLDLRFENWKKREVKRLRDSLKKDS